MHRYAIASRPWLPAALLGWALAVVLIAAAAPVWAAGDSAFVADVEDLPLMPGLSEVPNGTVIFDKPGGRIVEAYAEGAVSGAAVIDFYRQTLPQLGWLAVGETAYRREGERLEIVILGNDGDVVVRFSLEPE